MESRHVLTCDVGTTGCKTSLYRVDDDGLSCVARDQAGYPLLTTDDGGAEQRADDWWAAIGATSRAVMERSGLAPDRVDGVALCCQMQGSILVDEHGAALRNPMIYMDARATDQFRRGLQRSLLRVGGLDAYRTLRSLWITGGVAGTAKDPLWKYHWVREQEPELFARARHWLDVKDYLLQRATGQVAMTHDSAHVTFLYDTRPGRLGWSRALCSMFGVDEALLPPVVASTDVVGELTDGAAAALGLAPGTPVFGGGGDASLIPLGAGCLRPDDVHVYIGTSGWVVADVGKRMVDIDNFIASILGAIPGRYNYIAEQETSGLCLQWAAEQLAADGIGVLGEGAAVDRDTLYRRLDRVAGEVPPGAGGLLFTPWLHGNRAPREDPHARGMFFGLGLGTDKAAMIRAVLEGVALHKRWMLEAVERKVRRPSRIRFVGGGARSASWCQVLADVLGRTVEVVDEPQHAGAVGAAIVAAVGLGALPSFDAAAPLVQVAQSYAPRPEATAVHDRQMEVFGQLYKANRRLFRMTARGEGR